MDALDTDILELDFLRFDTGQKKAIGIRELELLREPLDKIKHQDPHLRSKQSD